MHNMKQVLYNRQNSNIQNVRLQGFWAEHEMNIGQCLNRDIPCVNQDHHDNKWKYRQTWADCNTNMDGGTRDLLATI
eukprot:984541-Heterocapsa_arctica.AAC.1